MIEVREIRINYEMNPMGVGHDIELSWLLQSDRRCVTQKSYRYQISRDKLFDDVIVDTGDVEQSNSAHIFINSQCFQPAKRYFVRVKVVDDWGEESAWSTYATFVTSLLEEAWKGVFVTGEKPEEAAESAACYLRGNAQSKGKIKEAYLFSTALGIYEVFINGQRVGNDCLTPGWTSYQKHLLYQTYDVTEFLQEGENCIGAHVGAGWFKGKMGFVGLRNLYGERTAFLCQLFIRYEDGSTDVAGTNASWVSKASPVVFSEIYDGETYDGTQETKDWNMPEYSPDASWSAVQVVPWNMRILTAQYGGQVREKCSVPVKDYITTPKGERVLDFGQNMAGWVRFRASGKAGDRAQLVCFETLDAEGNVYLDNLRTAKQMITYTFGQDGDFRYQPHFTYQGFRYALIKEWPCEPIAEDFEAVCIYSDMADTGDFTCDNPLVNRLVENIRWGMRSNFVDIPSDCPQRDERLGWTGDAQIFSRTASYLMNTRTFFQKWMQDVACDQTEEGGVPHVVPDIISKDSEKDGLISQGTHSAAAWADVAVIVPWVLYLNYGDRRILMDQYDSMKQWIGFMRSHAKDYIWNYKLQFGDWVALDAEEGSCFGATPNDLTCTAYFAYSTKLFSKIAGILGREDDREEYTKLYSKIVNKFRETFFESDGTLRAQTQTAHIVSLHFGLTPDPKKTMEGLVALLRKNGGHLTTGFVGTPYFCFALSEFGEPEEAYRLLLREDFPSWLYQVKMGATTVWEHWDGIKEDGSMWSADMNSFNHYAYGAVGEWLFRGAAGIDTSEEAPGFRRSFITPFFTTQLNNVKCRYETLYGTIASEWRLEAGIVTMKVKIPVNTSSTIRLTNAGDILNGDGLHFTPAGCGLEAQAGSGEYEIRFILKC